MQKIVPHLWYDTEAVEAAEFYVSVFGGNSRIIRTSNEASCLENTPSGTVETVEFELLGFRFNAISAGRIYSLNPSITFNVKCDSIKTVDAIWNQLSQEGRILMPMGTYPFGRRYGWIQDKYGLSWLIIFAGEEELTERIIPVLMFTGKNSGKAEEAMKFYTSIFNNASCQVLSRYGKDEKPDVNETVRYGDLILEGVRLGIMDNAFDQGFTFNEAVSLMVNCANQKEIDQYWNKLTAIPEAEKCGWLKDRYGLSWQVVPTILNEFLSKGTAKQRRRVTEAFLQMKKFDVAVLEKAYGKS